MESPKAVKKGRPLATTASGTLVSSLSSTVLIQQLSTISPDALLKQTQNRPFKVVHQLPQSSVPPDYSVLKNPLSVKDSAVLYNALIVSRHNWLYNVFETYWSRKEHLLLLHQIKELRERQKEIPDPEANKQILDLEERKRDRMSKLCDCEMMCGPHIFKAQFFMVREEKKLEEIHQESTGQEPPSQGELKTPEPKDQTSNETAQVELSKEGLTPKEDLKMGEIEEAKSSTDEPTLRPQEKTGDKLEEEKDKPEEGKKTSEGEEETSNAKDVTTKEPIAPSKEQGETSQTEVLANSPSSNSSFSHQEGPHEIKKETPIPPLPQPKAFRPSPPPPVQQKEDLTANLQNHIMISNLNAIARTDTSLNELMKIVATGNASNDQISLFQKYISKARELGDPNGTYRRQFEEKQAQKRLDIERRRRELYLHQQRRGYSYEAQRDARIMAYQERYLRNCIIVFGFTENTSQRFYLPKDSIVEVLENKPLGEGKDILVSFILVHNKEGDRKDITMMEEQNLETPTPSRRSTRSLQESAKPKEKTKEKSKAKSQTPSSFVPLYSTVTITLKSVPHRFVSVMQHSVNPQPEVRTKMTEIMAKGKKLPKSHCFLELDNNEDELLSENLRFNLQRLDYVNGGGKLKGRAMVKRIAEETGAESGETKKSKKR